MRSMLFVPADSERKLVRAVAAGADALILDLEDSVTAGRKATARAMAAEVLRQPEERVARWVRVNDLGSGQLLQDLAAVVPVRPSGIVLPKITGPGDITTVSGHLDRLEAANGLPALSLPLVVLVTETPAALLRIPALLELDCPRLRALSWGAEDLSAALGAGDPRRPDGTWRSVYEHARTQCLLGAHALSLEAIDTVYVDYRDLSGLERDCVASRQDGFTGRLAIHPDQVPIINRAYTPDEAECAQAQRIVDAFAASADAGTVAIDGKMYDLPHLKAARRVLGQRQEQQQRNRGVQA
jgi:citrate lyase subunit beta/citryl-CoA lyase